MTLTAQMRRAIVEVYDDAGVINRGIELLLQFGASPSDRDRAEAAADEATALVAPFTRLLAERNRRWVSPRDFGAVGNGIADDTAAVADAVEYSRDNDIPGLLLDGSFVVDGSVAITHPVQIFGRSAGVDKLRLNIDPTMPGLFIKSSDVIVRDLEIEVDTPDVIANGQGNNNTCISVGEWFNPAGLPLLQRIHLESLKLTRTSTSGAGHGMAILSRVSGLTGKNLSFIGGGTGSLSGRHGSAILAHWGGRSNGVRTAADPDFPLVQDKFAPGCYSHHPNNLRFENLFMRNTSRMIQLSGVYSVSVDGFDYDGGVDGGQLLDLVAGDELDTFAHPDDQGRVYTDISIRNGNARNLTGSGSNANSVIDITGFSTSKQLNRDLAAYASAPYTTEAYAGKAQPVYRMSTRWNVTFENIDFDGGPRAEFTDVTEYRGAIAIRTFNGNLTFKNVRARGNQGNLALQMANATGTISFEDCELTGGIDLDEVSLPKFVNCTLKVPPYPVLQVTLAGTSASWVLGATITGATSGARGELIEKVDGSTNSVLIQMENWTVFNTGSPETLLANGANGQTISAQTTFRNHAAYITGEAPVAYLAADVAKNAQTITVTQRLAYYARAGGSFGVGNTITGSVSGNTATVVAVQVGPAASGFPTLSTAGFLFLSGANGPFRQDDVLSNGLGVTARATFGWSAVLGLTIAAKSADFVAGGTITGALSAATATIVSQVWTDDRFELWISAPTGVFTVGETITGGTSGATGAVLSATQSRVIARRISGYFTNTETLTGGSSGRTATLQQHLLQPGNGVVTVSGQTGLFHDGETVTGSTGGSARVSLASAGELRALPYTTGVAPFAVGEWVKGSQSGARGQVSVIDGGALYLFSIRPTDLSFINGEPLVGDLGGRGTVNSAAGGIPATTRGGFPVALRIGDEILTTAGTFKVRSYHRVRETVIDIEPSHFAATTGATVTADHFSRSIGFDKSTFIGGMWGVEAEYCRMDFNDCVFEQAGQYAFVNDPGADVTMKRSRFRGNGLRRSSAHTASDVTRDLALVAGKFTGRELRFDSGSQVLINITSGADMEQLTIEDSTFAGSAGAAINLVSPSNGQPVRFNRNVNGSGVPVIYNNAWTPTLTFGGNAVGMAGTFTGTYQLLENLVFVEGRIVLTAKGSSTGQAQIGGWPVPVIGSRQSQLSVGIQVATGLTGGVYLRYSTTAADLLQTDGDGVASVTNSNITDTTVININGFYTRA